MMRIFLISRAFRAVVLSWGMVSFAPAAGLAAGALISPGTLHSIQRPAEPFGLQAVVLTAGELREKWLAMRLDNEMVQLAPWGDRDRCVGSQQYCSDSIRDQIAKCEFHAEHIDDAETQEELRKLAARYLEEAEEIESKARRG